MLDRDVMVWLDAALSSPGIRLAPLTPAMSAASARLPGAPHGDPADRPSAATAGDLGAVLVTADEALLAYGRLGQVNPLAAG
jgi:PIN domain nuclease of toxin-antitoxin system